MLYFFTFSCSQNRIFTTFTTNNTDAVLLKTEDYYNYLLF